MSGLRTDAYGSGSGAGAGSGAGLGHIIQVCGSAAGYASDGGPCLCCACAPAGSAYRFDRSYMWANNVLDRLNPPAKVIANYSVLFEELSCEVDLFDASVGGEDGDTWHILCKIDDLLIQSEPQVYRFEHSLIDRSYDGRCGFGTGHRDVDGPAGWSFDADPPDAGDPLGDRPIDRSFADGQWVVGRTVDISGSSGSGGGTGSGSIRFARTGISETLPLKTLYFHEHWRVIADSQGHCEDREGMIARMRGVASFEAGPDRHAPCVLLECKLVLAGVSYDVDSFSASELSFYNDPSGPAGGELLIGTSDEYLAGYSPVSSGTLFRDFHQTVPLASQQLEDGYVALAMTLKGYLASGDSRAQVYIGEEDANAFNGDVGYPASSTASNITGTTSTPTFVRGMTQTAQSCAIGLNMTGPLWSRVRAFDVSDPDHPTMTRIHERAVVRDLSLDLEIPMTVSNEQASMLVFNPGWSPAIDPISSEDDDLAVSVYRPCGSVCNEDLFAPLLPIEDGPSFRILVGPTGQERVYHWVGQTIIDTPNDHFVSNPEYNNTGETSCFNFAIAVPCDPVPGASPILFAKGGAFIEGGTTMVDFADEMSIRYHELAGSTHSQLSAPELTWVADGCIDDGTDRRIAVACVLSAAIPPAYPASVAYDRNAMPAGSTTYIVTYPGAGKGAPSVDVSYQITSQPTENEITPGVFSQDSCPPLMRLVRKCGEPETTAIIDPDELEADTVSVLIDGDRYALTQEQALGDPVAFESSTDLCPGGWYEAETCDGGGVNAVYQVADGMSPGEGVLIWYTVESGPNGGECVTIVQLQPTTTPADPPTGGVTSAYQVEGTCEGITSRTGDCFTQVDDPEPGPFLMAGQGGSEPVNPMHAVYAEQVARQLGCVSCGG